MSHNIPQEYKFHFIYKIVVDAATIVVVVVVAVVVEMVADHTVALGVCNP